VAQLCELRTDLVVNKHHMMRSLDGQAHQSGMSGLDLAEQVD
jgi:hypothetical protein